MANTCWVYVIGTEDEGYIGVTCNPEKRWNRHSKNTQYRVGEYIRKNKLTHDSLELIFCGSPTACFSLERYLRSKPNMGLNQAPGGLGGYTYVGRIFTEEHLHKLREAAKRSKHRHKPHTVKTRLKMSKSHLGRVLSTETKEKIRQAALRREQRKRDYNE